jgi:hypothetical protein
MNEEIWRRGEIPIHGSGSENPSYEVFSPYLSSRNPFRPISPTLVYDTSTSKKKNIDVFFAPRTTLGSQPTIDSHWKKP